MAYEPKTKPTGADPAAFIEETLADNPRKKEDAYRLLGLFSEATGFEPYMWGPSIIGYGTYHYKYASGHKGEAPLAGFSPRKANISLYLVSGDPVMDELISGLGKCKRSKGCVYINKVADINEDVLKQAIRRSVEVLRELYPES